MYDIVETHSELSCSVHWRERVWLQGLHLPSCYSKLHVPGIYVETTPLVGHQGFKFFRGGGGGKPMFRDIEGDVVSWS